MSKISLLNSHFKVLSQLALSKIIGGNDYYDGGGETGNFIPPSPAGYH